MAVGLQNVPDFSRPFLVESQKRDDSRFRHITRASELLQIWRDIEGEGENASSQTSGSRQHRNGCDYECRRTSTSVGEGSENGDDCSQISDESENQTFSGSENENNNSLMSEHSSDLGEIERGRVRQVFREGTNIFPKSHWSNEFNRKNCSRHCIGDMERERVCDGLINSHPEIGARRPLRRICGRQTLLDLILKAQKERERELISLSAQGPVSDFAHRNRIQALLRGRFLRSERQVVDERPSSVAATELGFLRERHAVSDIRDGFLSKLDNFASTSVKSNGSDTSCNDGNEGKPESVCPEGVISRNHHIAADLVGAALDGNRHIQELDVQRVESEEPVLDDEANQEHMPVRATRADSGEESDLAPVAGQHQEFTHVDLYGSRCGQINAADESLLESPNVNCSGSSYVDNQSDEPMSGVTSIHEVVDLTTDLEGNTNEEFDSLDASAQAQEFQELVTETEDSDWQHLNTAAFTECASGSGHSGNNVEGHDQMQESHDWANHDFQEDIREVGALYFPYEDEGNANNMELRELFSRRRVSGLLHSSFRQSLDQVLKSHVERLGHASVDWELENTPFPPIVEQDRELLNVDQSESAERNPFAPSSTLFEASQQLWNEELQGVDWPHLYSNQPLETEWGAISELRTDMARLQERINNMQGMLEACIDMKLELQRSLHQEVSAALNRSICQGDVVSIKDNCFNDESQWDHVKRGICCLCRHSKIDSLLYRCGHMCTCTDCAENLVQSKRKCPMCRAPAVEAVRAYFVQ